MDGARILMTDVYDGLPTTLLGFLLDKRAITFVLVKDFQKIPAISEEFPTPNIVPIVLNIQKNWKSTVDHLSAFPTLDCIFNFEGETLGNIFLQTGDLCNNVVRPIDINKDDIEISKIYDLITESICEERTLLINIITRKTPSTMPQPSSTTQNINVASGNFVLRRRPQKQHSKSTRSKARNTHIHMPLSRIHHGITPISTFLRKMFTSFNPCCNPPVFNMPHVFSATTITLATTNLVERNARYEEAHELKQNLAKIHESALNNWTQVCNINLYPDLEKQFQKICQDIRRKGEEGRKSLLDKVKKEAENNKQWDHVLGPVAVEQMKASREKEVDFRVQQFYSRKIKEARQKIDDEIRQKKYRAKAKFTRQILEEQVMELVRIKEKDFRKSNNKV